MNPILRSYFTQLDEAAARLGAALEGRGREAREQREAREALLKEHWSRGRELAALREDRERFEVLQGENERLQAREDELRERLRRVLKDMRALTEGLRE